jgi:hypothetical protein
MRHSSGEENLGRVAERISGAVEEFCGLRKRFRQQFHMAELCDFVRDRTGVAPDSPGRILRQLRSLGKLNYRVVDRRSSLYEMTRLEPKQGVTLLSDQFAIRSADCRTARTAMLFETLPERHHDDG